MFDLLQDGGKLVGVLFNREFEGGPPFGGSKIAIWIFNFQKNI
jgi:thiopurine S-methyltransferase